MALRVLAVAFIFVCTSIGWAILSATVYSRTERQDSTLRSMVASAWGSSQEVSPPSARFKHIETTKKKTRIGDKLVEEEIQNEDYTPLVLEASRVDVALDLEHRQKGLMWYATYKVDFTGNYELRNPSGLQESVEFTVKLPAANAIYDGLQISVDGKPLEVSNQGDCALVWARVAPFGTAHLAVV